MNGANVDGGWLLAVLEFARQTPWLHPILLGYTNFGLLVFVLLLAFAWRRARHRPPDAMAAVLWAPVTVLLGWAASNLVKFTVAEPRPCRSIARLTTLLSCPPPGDYAFPSNHAALAGASAAALWLAWRRLGVLAAALALLMGFSRVYVGVHYPHDVLAGFAIGVLAAALTPTAVARLGPVVSRMRVPGSRWAWWAGPGPTGRDSAAASRR